MKSGKNLHLEHLEDEIINQGSKGGEKAIKLLKDMGKFLSGTPGQQISVTTKFDGAPAIVCGIDPADNRFFVGTKSVFAVTNPKICKSENDCFNIYDGVLAQKLATSYKYLKNIGIKGVLQGDLMFTDDLKNVRIDEQEFLTFRPNTITYAAPSKSKLAEQIRTAKIGIVFHTKYTGDSLQEMTSSFRIDDNDYKTNDKNVWAQKAEFKNIGNIASLTASERDKYDSAIRKAEGSLRQTGTILNEIQSGKKTLQIDTEFKKFFNQYVKVGQNIPSVDKAYVDFYHHLGKEYDKIISKNKTLKAQSEKAFKFVEIVEFIGKNEHKFKMIIASYMNIQVCKKILVDKMNKISKLNMFVDMGNGDYKTTVPEGFVCIAGKDAVKLVDRLEFSKLNFIVPKSW